jgi:ketosteroid isomerase-like protein
MSERAQVLFVNGAFYDAFRSCDLETMDALWAREAPVACIHPGWRALLGREEVMESWEGILTGGAAPEVHCRAAEAFVEGADAFVVCYEVIGTTVLVATNIFRKEAGAWRLVHHQAGPCDLTTAAFDDEPEDSPMQ